MFSSGSLGIVIALGNLRHMITKSLHIPSLAGGGSLHYIVFLLFQLPLYNVCPFLIIADRSLPLQIISSQHSTIYLAGTAVNNEHSLEARAGLASSWQLTDDKLGLQQQNRATWHKPTRLQTEQIP